MPEETEAGSSSKKSTAAEDSNIDNFREGNKVTQDKPY